MEEQHESTIKREKAEIAGAIEQRLREEFSNRLAQQEAQHRARLQELLNREGEKVQPKPDQVLNNNMDVLTSSVDELKAQINQLQSAKEQEADDEAPKSDVPAEMVHTLNGLTAALASARSQLATMHTPQVR